VTAVLLDITHAISSVATQQFWRALMAAVSVVKFVGRLAS
jgi:hypothetical protein